MRESTSKYFKTYFDKKQLIKKGVIFSIATIIVVALSLSFYMWLKDYQIGTEIGKNPFWYISITWNPGIGFSQLNGNLPAIYSIQSVMFVLLLAIFIFLTKDACSCSFVALATLGGLFNLIQRASQTGEHAGCVLDYFSFGFMNFAIFNWPDVFVVIGIFGFLISFITFTIVTGVRESKAQKKHEK